MVKGISTVFVILLILLIVGGAYFLIQQLQSNVSDLDNLNESEQPELPETETSAGELSGEETETPQTYNVEISGFAFVPSELTINVGDTVIWTNMDSVTHTVTSDSGDELDSEGLSSGETFSHIFNTAGSFDYHCTPHSSMKGSIIVE